MNVRLLVAMAGHRTHWGAGEIREVSEDEAERLVRAGFAEYIVQAPAATIAIQTAEDKRPAQVERRPGRKPKGR